MAALLGFIYGSWSVSSITICQSQASSVSICWLFRDIKHSHLWIAGSSKPSSSAFRTVALNSWLLLIFPQDSDTQMPTDDAIRNWSDRELICYSWNVVLFLANVFQERCMIRESKWKCPSTLRKGRDKFGLLLESWKKQTGQAEILSKSGIREGHFALQTLQNWME